MRSDSCNAFLAIFRPLLFPAIVSIFFLPIFLPQLHKEKEYYHSDEKTKDFYYIKLLALVIKHINAADNYRQDIAYFFVFTHNFSKPQINQLLIIFFMKIKKSMMCTSEYIIDSSNLFQYNNYILIDCLIL